MIFFWYEYQPCVQGGESSRVSSPYGVRPPTGPPPALGPSEPSSGPQVQPPRASNQRGLATGSGISQPMSHPSPSSPSTSFFPPGWRSGGSSERPPAAPPAAAPVAPPGASAAPSAGIPGLRVLEGPAGGATGSACQNSVGLPSPPGADAAGVGPSRPVGYPAGRGSGCEEGRSSGAPAAGG